jgi:hypothetical protein
MGTGNDEAFLCHCPVPLGSSVTSALNVDTDIG